MVWPGGWPTLWPGPGGPVLWVPVRLMVAERRSGGKRGKSDPIDALAVAKAASNQDNTPWLAVHRLNEPGRDLRHLVDQRRRTVAARTELICCLRWELLDLGLGQVPADLTTAKAPRQLTERLERLAPAVLAQAGVLPQLCIDNCADLARLSTKIKTLDQHIEQLVEADWTNLLSIVGVGPITAATIVGELGDPDRLRSGAALARMAGTAPIPVSTANTDRHRLDRRGNRRLNNALHTIATVQARHEPRATALITKHQENKGKRGALRILKRHLSDVVYRKLRIDIKALTSQHTAT